MTNNEINVTATCITALANQPNSEEKIKLLLQSLFNSHTQKADFDVEKNTEPSVSSKLIFTQKEINLMPKTFKKEFRTDGCTAHVRKRKCGKNSYTYDIRYRKNGYDIAVTNKNLEVAKKLFIEKLKNAERICKSHTDCKSLDEFTTYYFEKFRKPKVAELTYKFDCMRYKNHIKPILGAKSIKKITPSDCQAIIDSLAKEGKGKTANEVYSILSIIFKGAIAHKLIKDNPLAIVVKESYESKHGKALTKEEEIKLLTFYKGTRYEPLFAIALYTGLRPNEYKTAKINDKFIIAINSKRKNKKLEYKRIPITKMLTPYIEGIEEFNFPSEQVMRDRFNEILPHHVLYDLRTTFYTRCKECGIADAARDEFVGHSLGVLGNTYTDLSDEYLLKEAEKFKY